MTINELVIKADNNHIKDNYDGTYSVKIKAISSKTVRPYQYCRYIITECDVCGNTCPKRLDHSPKTKRTYCAQECFQIMQTTMNKRKVYKEGWRVKESYNGYVMKRIWDDPMYKKGEWVTQHRYNIEQHIGRRLLKTEIVHHIDMDKTNNNIDNLWVCSASDHTKAHSSMNVKVADLMKLNLVSFNRETGKYNLITKEV